MWRFSVVFNSRQSTETAQRIVKCLLPRYLKGLGYYKLEHRDIREVVVCKYFLDEIQDLLCM